MGGGDSAGGGRGWMIVVKLGGSAGGGGGGGVPSLCHLPVALVVGPLPPGMPWQAGGGQGASIWAEVARGGPGPRWAVVPCGAPGS